MQGKKGSKDKDGGPAFLRWRQAELSSFLHMLVQLGAGRTEQLRAEVRASGGW